MKKIKSFPFIQQTGMMECGPTCLAMIFKYYGYYNFPFYEYGSVPGHIRQISLTPDEHGQYNLYVALGDPGRLKGLLQPGMDGTAVVIIEEKTLLQYFFRNLKKGYHRVLGGEIL